MFRFFFVFFFYVGDSEDEFQLDIWLLHDDIL